jgi:hypothetical protein
VARERAARKCERARPGSLPGLVGAGEGIVAPGEIAFTVSIPVPLGGIPDVTLSSYARNRLGHQSIVASGPLVIPWKSPEGPPFIF